MFKSRYEDIVQVDALGSPFGIPIPIQYDHVQLSVSDWHVAHVGSLMSAINGSSPKVGLDI